jgi:GAF domain-containing protein
VPFTEWQIALVQAFADQAVIAIENVRLFKELGERNREVTEALEQQTATAEILRVISSSPTNLQPVFDAIVRSASRLCGGEYAIVTRYDGELLHLAAQYNPRPGTAEETARSYPRVVRRDASFVVRALLTGAVVHVANVDTEELPPEVREVYGRIGLRAAVCVPMFHEGRPVGVVAVSRGSPGAFTSRQIDLLQTFADQAVIAIENVRLFKELEARNRDLTESLERQTATAEILRVIASSPTDLQPVFTAIAESAKRLLGGFSGSITRLIDNALHLGALTSTNPAGDDAARAMFPMPLTGVGIHTDAARTRAPIFVVDVETDPRVSDPRLRDMARARGWRSFLAVPMLRGTRYSARSASAASRPVPSKRRSSRCSRLSPTRPSSPSRTCGCSRSCRRRIARSRRRMRR